MVKLQTRMLLHCLEHSRKFNEFNSIKYIYYLYVFTYLLYIHTHHAFSIVINEFLLISRDFVCCFFLSLF